jgi:hypothetical protein
VFLITEVVAGYPSGCRLSMRKIYSAHGEDKRDTLYLVVFSDRSAVGKRKQ